MKYVTSLFCKRGHACFVRKKDHRCPWCLKEEKQRYRARHPEVVRLQKERIRRRDGAKPQRFLTEVERQESKRRARRLNRLRRKKRRMGIIRELWAVQEGECRWCGQGLPENFQMDHVIPVSKGGPHTRNNLALACPPCNRQKSDTLPVSLFSFAKRA